MIPISITTPNTSVGAISTTIQPHGVCGNLEVNTSTVDVNPKKKSVVVQSVTIKSNENNAYLRTEVIQKMINRFLNEKKMPKQKLAEALEITVKSLNLLCSKKATHVLIHKVNLPLVKLYCKTRFW
jgi:predicted XRE-type DNA-binding protein